MLGFLKAMSGSNEAHVFLLKPQTTPLNVVVAQIVSEGFFGSMHLPDASDPLSPWDHPTPNALSFARRNLPRLPNPPRPQAAFDRPNLCGQKVPRCRSAMGNFGL